MNLEQLTILHRKQGDGTQPYWIPIIYGSPLTSYVNFLVCRTILKIIYSRYATHVNKRNRNPRGVDVFCVAFSRFFVARLVVTGGGNTKKIIIHNNNNANKK